MLAHDIILRPVITEKSMMGIPNKRYTFAVAKNANKIQIKQAIEEVFKGDKVIVAKVNTVNMRGRHRRQGATEGYTASWKKAIVTLTPASGSIQFFEGMV